MTSEGLRAFPCLRFQGLRWAEEAVRSLGRRRGRMLLWDAPHDHASPDLPGWERVRLGDAPPAIPARPTALPFRENAFDVVVLLHGFADLDEDGQGHALDEGLRVARRLLLVVTPLAGLKLEIGLKLLYEFSVAHLGYDHPGTASLRRRVNGGLPDEGSLVGHLEGKGFPHEIFRFGSLFSGIVFEMLSQYLAGLENGRKLVGLFRELVNLRFHTEGARGACLVGLLAVAPGGARILGRLRERFSVEEPARPGLSADEMSLVHLLFHLQGLQREHGQEEARTHETERDRKPADVSTGALERDRELEEAHTRAAERDRELEEVRTRAAERDRELEAARTELDRLRCRLDRIQSNPLLRAYARLAEREGDG